MTYVAGIDGGQSGTQAAIVDERGRVLGRGNAGPSDEIGHREGSTRLRDALANALEDARRNANLPPSVRYEAIVAGLTGYEGRIYGERPSLPTARLVIVHDAIVAHAGALAGRSGVVVIAGTGSIAYVVDDDFQTGIRGGLGYLFGDEGSAFWIVKTVLAYAVVHEGCAVARAATAFFERETLRDVFMAFYHGEVDRERFASFAKDVLAMARAQPADRCATETVASAQRHLARLAAWAVRPPWRWHARVAAAFTGGLTSDPGFKRGVVRAVHDAAERADVVEPAYAPALGAALLALREAGTPCDRLTE